MCQIDDLDNQGQTALRAENYSLAIQLSTSAIAKAPQTYVLFLNRSVAFAHTLQWDEAIADAQTFINANPLSPLGYCRKGRALLGAQRYDEAIKSYKEASARGDTTTARKGINDAESARDAARSNSLKPTHITSSDATNHIPTTQPPPPPPAPAPPAPSTFQNPTTPRASSLSKSSLSEAATAREEQIRKRIDEIATSVLREGPAWLLDTHHGLLCSRDEVKRVFEESPDYQPLVRLFAMLNSEDMQKDGFADQTLTRIVKAFFQYAMLSHRWGAHEPLFGDVRSGQISLNVYKMTNPPGITKLQKFCEIARANGFRWCWDDTCCIDKKNNTELQTSILSMFLWYRNSAMTIVYLVDVVTFDDLVKSVWFTRGWTLQELLAPSVIRFYSQNWSLLVNELNHKTISAIRLLLMKVTQIDEQSLLQFQPGMEQPRAMLAWASKRKTHEVEDAAYSIMALFRLNLPIQYSDKDRALGRLLGEIVASSSDISILDWVGESNNFNSCLPASLACFESQTWTPPALSPHELQLSMVPMVQFLSTVPDVNQRLYTTFFSGHHRVTFSSQLFHLPCIVYRVSSIKFDPEGDSTPLRHCFTIKVAEGLLHDLTVMMQAKIQSPKRNLNYAIVRLWHPHYLTSFEQNDTSLSNPSTAPLSAAVTQRKRVAELLVRLSQPFHALLLVQEQLGGDWRRIMTLEPIEAKVRDVTLGARELKIEQIVVR